MVRLGLIAHRKNNQGRPGGQREKRSAMKSVNKLYALHAIA